MRFKKQAKRDKHEYGLMCFIIIFIAHKKLSNLIPQLFCVTNTK